MFLKGNKKALLRQALNSFAKNSETNKGIRLIQMKLLNTTYGSLLDSFQKWKAIPTKEELDPTIYKKCSIFEQKLGGFYLHYLKINTWEPLRNIEDDAEAIQKRAVNKMAWFCMSDLKKAFHFWAN